MRGPACLWSLVSAPALPLPNCRVSSTLQEPPNSHLLLAPTVIPCWGVGICPGRVRAETGKSGCPTLAHFLGVDLKDVMATSRDQQELLWAWQGWRDAVGRPLREPFKQYVQLSNKAARLNGEAPPLAGLA